MTITIDAPWSACMKLIANNGRITLFGAWVIVLLFFIGKAKIFRNGKQIKRADILANRVVW